MYYWERSYPREVSWSDAPSAPVMLESLLLRAAERWPTRCAIDYREEQITYASLASLAASAASGLQALGAGPDMNIGLHLQNSVHYVVAFFGAQLAGATVVNFSPAAGALELARQVKDSNSRILLTSSTSLDQLGILDLVGQGLLDAVIVCDLEKSIASSLGQAAQSSNPPRPAGARIDFSWLLAHRAGYRKRIEPVQTDDVAVLQYTGGTTGVPKGAMLTHANFCATLDSIDRWESVIEIGEGARILAVLPFTHVIGLSVILLRTISKGRELVVHSRFDSTAVLTEIARKQIAAFAGVPAIYAALVRNTAAGAADLSSLRICGSGGAALSEELLTSFARLAGTFPLDGYALTETTCAGTWQIPGTRPRAGSVGLPLPNVLIEIVDVETGTKLLPPGACGEICFRGPHVMRGYWNAPEATQHAFRGGRFHSGDVGFLSEDGYVTVVDRLKDMILTGGYNVYPGRIEEALCRHPAVAEAAVIGVDDAELGQVAMAFVVPRREAGECTISSLYAHLSGRLARYEIPVDIELRVSLPRTGTGKISRLALAEEFKAYTAHSRAEQ